jgi:hypothetical protein
MAENFGSIFLFTFCSLDKRQPIFLLFKSHNSNQFYFYLIQNSSSNFLSLEVQAQENPAYYTISLRKNVSHAFFFYCKICR